MVICEKMTLLHNFTLLLSAGGAPGRGGVISQELAQIYGIHGTPNDEHDDDDDTRQAPARGKMRIIVESNETADDESDFPNGVENEGH